MKKITKFICNFKTPILLLLFGLFFSGGLTAQFKWLEGENCPDKNNWDNWEVEYLDAGRLICSPETIVELRDEFDINGLNNSTEYKGNSVSDFWLTYFEGASCGPHYVCEDQIYTSDNVRVEQGQLILTARHSPGYTCSDDGETREFTSGMVKGNSAKYAFNYGRYTIVCDFPIIKNPLHSGEPASLWPAFWMNHHEEIDIFENYGDVNDYRIGSHGSGGNSCTANVITESLLGMHTYEVEWTPFKTTFFFDGQVVKEIFKYYNMDTQNELDVVCGGEIPEGYYKVNPAFIHTKQNGEPRYFLPIIGLGILPDCFECGYNNSPSENPCEGPNGNWRQNTDYIGDNLMPAEWRIERVAIDEVTYQYVKIKKGFCSDFLCPGRQYCFSVHSEYLNGTINDPAPEYTPAAWHFSSNVTPVTPTPPNAPCVTYNGPLNGESIITVQADIPAGPNNAAFVVDQSISYPDQAPEIEWQFVCPHRFYIRTHGRCLDDLTISVTHNNLPIPYIVVQNTRELIEITVSEPEGDLTVTYPNVSSCDGSTASVTQHFAAPNTTPTLNFSYSVCGKTIICIIPNGGCVLSYDLGGLSYQVVSNNSNGICLEVQGTTGTITVNHINGTIVQPFQFQPPLPGTYTVSGVTNPLNATNTYASQSSFVLIRLGPPEGATNLTGTIVSGSGSLIYNGNNAFSLIFPRGTTVTVRFCYSLCEQVYCFTYTFTNTGISGFELKPNPANDQIRITFSSDPGDPQPDSSERSTRTSSHENIVRTVSIVDLASKVCLRKEEAVFNGSEVVLDISNLAPGMYFVQIINAEGKVEQVIPFTKMEN